MVQLKIKKLSSSRQKVTFSVCEEKTLIVDEGKNMKKKLKLKNTGKKS
jgi:hypothetical protein